MKDVRRILLSAALAMCISEILNDKIDATCHLVQQPDHFCGVSCLSSGNCTHPASASTYCIQVDGGCGSMQNTTCCPGGSGPF